MNKLDFLREAMSTWQASMDAFDRSEESSSERVAAAQRTSERLASVAQTLALDRLAAQLDVEPCREKSSGAGSSPQPDAN